MDSPFCRWLLTKPTLACSPLHLSGGPWRSAPQHPVWFHAGLFQVPSAGGGPGEQGCSTGNCCRPADSMLSVHVWGQHLHYLPWPRPCSGFNPRPCLFNGRDLPGLRSGVHGWSLVPPQARGPCSWCLLQTSSAGSGSSCCPGLHWHAPGLLACATCSSVQVWGSPS